MRLTVGRVARRWAHLVLGGALLMPFYLLTLVALPLLVDAADPLSDLGLQLAAFGCALPLAALAGLLFPVLRPLEATAVRALCAVPAERLADGPAVSWAARRRSALWFTAHLAAGGIVSGMTLTVPPAVVLLLVMPFGGVASGLKWQQEFGGWTAPAAGLALLALLLGTGWGVGALLARCAPPLLGPTPADRLAAAERRAAELAARNRLARELHDAVGHALSAVTLQAGAAGRVLDTDPGFARQALAAIEETTREAVAELDTVLGLLRTDEEIDGTGESGEFGEFGASAAAGTAEAAASAPTLDGLEALFRGARAAGVRITAELSGDRAGVPPVVSREAYRIVQEGLSNALRHASPAWVTVQLHVCEGELRLTVKNPMAAAVEPGGAARAAGGRGLRGITERARLLGGTASAGATDGVWRLTARLPVAGPADGQSVGRGDGGTA
ncbi:sensor histidine kinase [Streptomyces sp. BHT-5-2]|uniref:sensor histidine kinase n=1 Tax=Streptomyces sp. BHT-5-2 TaxID=2866715 RepID=UPI0037DA155B